MNMIRELNEFDINEVFGGLQAGYKFCWDGPAGTGVYPSYTDCGPGPTNREVYAAFFDGFNKTSGQPPI
jgi:hypothetical protein